MVVALDPGIGIRFFTGQKVHGWRPAQWHTARRSDSTPDCRSGMSQISCSKGSRESFSTTAGGSFEDFVAERASKGSSRMRKKSQRSDEMQLKANSKWTRSSGRQPESYEADNSKNGRGKEGRYQQKQRTEWSKGGHRKGKASWRRSPNQSEGKWANQSWERNSDSRDDRYQKDFRTQKDRQYDSQSWSAWDEAEETETVSLRDQVIGEIVYGVAPVLAVLKAKRRQVHKLLVQDHLDSKKRKDASAVTDAVTRAQDLGVDVQHVTKHDLNMVVDNKPHQGLAVDCTPLDYIPLDKLPKASNLSQDKRHVWLILDEIMDPQNLGAIIRTAYFLGASGIVVSSKNSAPLSPAVSKVSSGIVEFLPMHSCVKLPQFLEEAQKDGWTVAGTSGDGETVACTAFKPTKPVALVVGNEGYGLRKTVRQSCEVLLRIDSGFKENESFGLDSLNVSVATGILLHSIMSTGGK